MEVIEVMFRKHAFWKDHSKMIVAPARCIMWMTDMILVPQLIVDACNISFGDEIRIHY